MALFYTLYGKSYETRKEVDDEAQVLLEEGYSRAFSEIEEWDTKKVYGNDDDSQFESDTKLAEERNRLIDFRG